MSHAVLWWLAGLVRAGTVAVGAFVKTPVGKSVVRSAVNHALVGGLAYWYLDRGSGVPPTERYVQVALTSAKSEALAMKTEGQIAQPASGWATSFPWNTFLDNCEPVGSTAYEWNAVPAGTLFCYTGVCGGNLCYGSYARDVSVGACYSCCNLSSNSHVCTTTERNNYGTSGQVIDESEIIFNDSALDARMKSAVGSIQRWYLVETLFPVFL
jgi:hypothetical protein